MTSEPMQCGRCGEPHAGCGAHTRAGRPCSNKPMSGQRVCRMHGGSSPKAIAAAEQRQLEQKADAVVRQLWGGLDAAVPVKDPAAALEQLAGALTQLVDEAGNRVAGLQHVAGGKDLTQLRAEVVLFERALGHLRALLVDMSRLGIASRAVELQQGQADLVLAALRIGLEAAADLTTEQRNAVLGAFLGALRRAQGAVVVGEVSA